MSEVRRRFASPIVLITILFWGALYALLTAAAGLNESPFFTVLLYHRIVTCTIGASLCGWMYVTLRPIHHAPFVVQLAVAFLAAFMCAVAWTLANSVISEIIIPSPMPSERVTLMDLWFTGHLLFWVFLAWCCVYFAINYRGDLIARELDLAKTRTLALDAQNRLLRYQLNPHFLFNTLNALSALILDGKRDTAERMLLALSRFLRHSLEQEPADKIPLKVEVEAQEEYLSIEQIRFGDKLRYVKAIDADALDVPVPSFILQPAVENAMKHAVAQSRDPVTVEISAKLEGDDLVVHVRDDASHAEPTHQEGLGVGLNNVRNRLELIYGAAAQLKTSRLDPHGFDFELRLPRDKTRWPRSA